MKEKKELNSKIQIEENLIKDANSTFEAEQSDDFIQEIDEEWSGITKALTTVSVIKTSALNSDFTSVANSINAMTKMPKINDSALTAMAKANESMRALAGVTDAMKNLTENSAVKALSEIAIKNVIPQYTFKSAVFERMNYSMANILKQFSDRLSQSFTNEIAEHMRKTMSNMIPSPAMKWVQSIDFSPLKKVLESFQLNEKIINCFKQLKNTYLTVMYECKWFPCAGLTADEDLMLEVFEVLNTSRGASKRREQRIDKLILSYYTPERIKQMKRTWKESDLEPHIKRMLGQAIDAHFRGEYALTISCLATMWEGLIHHKLHIEGRYGQKKTKEGFAKLIDENDYEVIFSDFYENLIVSQCDTVDDVKEGVPNRNGVSHSKYKKYPNKKASLNAILLTDFIIKLEPLDIETCIENE